MLPNWLNKQEKYFPSKEGNGFILKSINTLGKVMSKIQVQKGHEKSHTMPPIFKLFLMLGGIIIISITQNKIVLMAYAAIILFYICTWPAIDIARILKSATLACLFTLLLLIPAIIMNNGLIINEFKIVIKVFFSVLTVTIFNHTTQWNHITSSLRKIHIPGLFIFIIDITLKYIVLLGNLIVDLLTSLKLRSIGKNNKKYYSIGGVMGITFIRGSELNKEMYEAMQCRCFTDDYNGI